MQLIAPAASQLADSRVECQRYVADIGDPLAESRGYPPLEWSFWDLDGNILDSGSNEIIWGEEIDELITHNRISRFRKRILSVSPVILSNMVTRTTRYSYGLSGRRTCFFFFHR